MLQNARVTAFAVSKLLMKNNSRLDTITLSFPLRLGLNYSKAFIEYLNDMDDIYKNIEEYKPNKKRKIFILFDRITGMLSNKKRNELFVRAIKLNISLVFITQFYFPAPKNIRLNYIQGFILKIPNKREL